METRRLPSRSARSRHGHSSERLVRERLVRPSDPLRPTVRLCLAGIAPRGKLLGAAPAARYTTSP